MLVLWQLLGQLRETKTIPDEGVPKDNYSLAFDRGIVANVPHSMWHTITVVRFSAKIFSILIITVGKYVHGKCV